MNTTRENIIVKKNGKLHFIAYDKILLFFILVLLAQCLTYIVIYYPREKNRKL